MKRPSQFLLLSDRSSMTKPLCWVLLATVASLSCNGPTLPSRTLPSPTAPSAVPTGSSPFPTGSYTGLTGSYTLTLIASPSCAMVTDSISHQAMPFPESARVRHYNAEFSGISGVLTRAGGGGGSISIGGIDHYAYYGSPLLWVNDRVLTIIVPPDAEDLAGRNDSLSQGGPTCSGGDYWWEGSNDSEVFDACGTWRASMDDPTRIAGTINGAFGYYRGGGTGVGPNWKTVDLFCRATDHQFILTAR
jgi:hypothetical protein